MIGCEFGRNDAEVKEIVKNRTQGKETPEELAERGLVVGTANQVLDQLGKLTDVGVQRVMLQWLALEDTDRLGALGNAILPQLKG
jgi:alkanesulfonate monooxygenase SsuD/methylene tetrahydromethanopterin reductase-like flavin-dependent oxidoreductase (luciferase family)